VAGGEQCVMTLSVSHRRVLPVGNSASLVPKGGPAVNLRSELGLMNCS
jgi:hypothetical protein